MRMLSRPSAVLVLAFASFGCASTGTPAESAISKGATELSCPSDQISVTSLGDNRYGARGCGRYVAYEFYGPRTLASLRITR